MPERRKIIHIDMDAFYAAVEQRDNADLRGKPIAVGWSGPRSVVATASYEARRFGVHSALPSVTAARKCPELIFVPPRFEVYRAVSRQLRQIFAAYTPLIEPLSLDEAYLDVSEDLRGLGSATRTAEAIRAEIRRETGLTASAGVSYNKFLAKLASDARKPDGLFVITPAMGPELVADLPVGKVHGIGPATTARLNRLGIHTGGDLRAAPLALLVREFGKAGQFYHQIAQGIDERPVQPDRARKSIGAENTFAADLYSQDAALQALQPILAKLWRHCQGGGVSGRTLTLKVKYADFQQITRSHTAPRPLASAGEMEQVMGLLLAPLFPSAKGIRLLGLTLSSLDGEGDEAGPGGQLELAL